MDTNPHTTIWVALRLRACSPSSWAIFLQASAAMTETKWTLPRSGFDHGGAHRVSVVGTEFGRYFLNRWSRLSCPASPASPGTPPSNDETFHFVVLTGCLNFWSDFHFRTMCKKRLTHLKQQLLQWLKTVSVSMLPNISEQYNGGFCHQASPNILSNPILFPRTPKQASPLISG